MKTIHIPLILVFLYLGTIHVLAQNCSLTIDAGPDLIICDPETITLTASTSEPFVQVNWEPAALFSDPNSLETSVTIDNSTTIQVTAITPSDINLISNGDFNQGNIGFTSTYELGTGGNFGPLSSEGQYTIVNNAEDAHTHYESCTDHNGAGGNMMVVNGSGEPNNVWCQSITVNQNTDYMFSAWVASAISQNPAQLQFSINNNLLGSTFTAPASTCLWTQFFEIWNSGTASTIDICVVNVNDDPAGNDFAIDDISFREVCEATDEVLIELLELDASFSIASTLCQSTASMPLDALLTSTATPGGVWTLNGIQITSLEPSTLDVGNHMLQYSVTQADCELSTEQAFEIIESPSSGTVTATPSNCSGITVNYNLFELLDGESADGIWEEISTIPSTNGSFNTASGTFSTENQAPGTYRFQYSLEASSICPGATSVVSIIVEESPVADAGEDLSLGCGIPEVSIGSAATSTGNMTYLWQAEAGSPIDDPTVAILEVNIADTYTLNVTDLDNGCTATDEVTISELPNTIELFSQIGPITCFGQQDGSILLEDVSGGTAPYRYALNGGAFTSFPQFNNLSAGAYTLEVQDANGCNTFLEFELEQPVELAVDINSNLNATPAILLLGDSLTISLEVNKPMNEIVEIKWNEAPEDCDNCMQYTTSPSQNTTFTAVVTDNNGCTASAILPVLIDQTVRAYIPNAFSPNGDGVNDAFMIYADESITEVLSLEIMDRWGNQVYAANNFTPGDPKTAWDGHFKGKRLNPGVFIYTAQIQLSNGETVHLSGDINLVY